MASAQPQDLRVPGITGSAARLAMLLILAAFVALLALGRFGGQAPSETGESQARQESSVAGSEGSDQQVFDGRGKWTGYAR